MIEQVLHKLSEVMALVRAKHGKRLFLFGKICMIAAIVIGFMPLWLQGTMTFYVLGLGFVLLSDAPRNAKYKWSLLPVLLSIAAMVIGTLVLMFIFQIL
jgi:hypothetical protein